MELRLSSWLRPQFRRRCLALGFALGLVLSHLLSSLTVQAMEAGDPSIGRSRTLEQVQLLSNSSIQHQHLGQWTEAQRLIESGLELLSQYEQTHRQTGQNSEETATYATALGQALNTQGSLSLAMGNGEDALEQWQQAEAAYRQARDEVGRVRSRLNQAQALQRLGFYRRAIAQLAAVDQELNLSAKLAPLKITTLQRWGELLRLTGEIPLAKEKLEQGLSLAQQFQQRQKVPSLLLSLGYLAQANDEPETAMNYYQQVVDDAISLRSPELQAKGKLAQLELYGKQAQWSQSQALWPDILEQLSQLPLRQSTLYQRIRLVQLLTKSSGTATPSTSQLPIFQRIATETLHLADTLGDPRSRAYALGSLGEIQRLQQQWQTAAQNTQAALEIAQALHARDMLWRWQGQLGDIKLQQNDRQGAIAAYRAAVIHLNSLRGDLVAMQPGLQYSFQEDIEPLYRQLISLLLEDTDASAEGQLNEAQQLVEDLQGIELKPIASSPSTEAQQLMENLQLMELEDFLREFCNDAPTQLPVTDLDPDAAILRFIVLRDRVEILVNFPNQPIQRYRTDIAQVDLDKQLENLRRTLVIRSRRRFLKPSQQLYDELIRPMEAEFAAHHTKTLVFALDGSLQNIPMAALHDGEQYLVERYRVALIPRLRLKDTPALSADQLHNLLAVGISEPRQGFSALPQVGQELADIGQQFPKSQRLQDQAFTETNFRSYLRKQDPAIVHVATHGQFSSRAKETFLLAWDSLIHVGGLDTLIQSASDRGNPGPELLVLSACETAVGDNRASLGLAGVAFKAGARSTLATLWAVNDEASAIFMEQFYQALKQPGTGRADALRQAQRMLLQNPIYKHPIYWAPYVLLGSWW